ncbi:tripartite tricarboxylate transporter substrate binding protein [Ramlibacter sp. AW1]|uniref:Tripartite tricarboxylate transporter substrate binding protein n=1 Tax=Ramlibacter aurantiacus TaxID=2801330 RepID=A0A936ZTT4_9BURK|nr:tripartite tricarboxylate transporter substrate binding protein [Ramlibacter aurantiacus]MBL0422426.1 tripartite tricarboxylate transporter substrate binding protein [Ramlibacter aurantiacus]
MKALKFLSAVLLAGLALASVGLAQANTYPSKPVHIIVPYPAGGSGDLLARLVASRLSQVMGQQFVVENKAGASGNIGTQFVATAPPDGHTLLLATDIQFAINPLLYPQLAYNPDKDFEPVSLAAYIEFMLAVPSSLQVNTLSDFIAKAKQNPGGLNYASTGHGSSHQLAMEHFSSIAGIKLNHVPYKGSGQALPDLLSGNVQAMFFGVSQGLPHIRSGKLKGLAVGSTKRLRALPDTPTVAEFYPGFEVVNWWGFYAPKGTPREIVNRLNAEVVKIIKAPDVWEQLEKGGFAPFGSTPAELVARTVADRTKWAKVIEQANIKPQAN